MACFVCPVQAGQCKPTPVVLPVPRAPARESPALDHFTFLRGRQGNQTCSSREGHCCCSTNVFQVLLQPGMFLVQSQPGPVPSHKACGPQEGPTEVSRSTHCSTVLAATSSCLKSIRTQPSGNQQLKRSLLPNPPVTSTAWAMAGTAEAIETAKWPSPGPHFTVKQAPRFLPHHLQGS